MTPEHALVPSPSGWRTGNVPLNPAAMASRTPPGAHADRRQAHHRGDAPRRHRRGRADERERHVNLVHYAAWLVKEMSVGVLVAIDPRQLKPGELARLLNSTPLGEVISERQLHRHRTRAGSASRPTATRARSICSDTWRGW